MKIQKPDPSQLNAYYKTYLKYVSEEDLIDALTQQTRTGREFIKSISLDKEAYAYGDGKWMLKEVVGHLCDTERILTCRALRISRNDKTPLPGFDENQYMPNSNFAERALNDILDEFIAVRNSLIALFNNMNEEMFDRRGTANHTDISVRDLLFFIVAHERHHLQVIKERYLS